MADTSDVTGLLHAWHGGDRAALDALLPRLYDTLREMAAARLRHEPAVQTLNPTALVHEALIRLIGANTDWTSRTHFLSLAALHMRSVLVDQARSRLSDRHGGGAVRVTLSQADAVADARMELDLLALDQALKNLHRHDERSARIVEMSYFAGMQREEIAAVIGVSVPTVDRDLRFARAWLNQALS
jgi:RNA polymerase sigma factor (TIGR02999 family)